MASARSARSNLVVGRREFLAAGGAAALTAIASRPMAVWAAEEGAAAGEAKRPKLHKAVKYAMIGEGDSPQEKLELVKSLGFEGVEVDSPSDVDREALRRASEATGVKIHGTICSTHWRDRLSDPDPAVRAKGLAALKTAIEDAKFYGGDTVLLVPGKVTNAKTENFDQVWKRSQAEVRKVLPDAEKNGVKICIETVWNNFITTPQQLCDYIDEFDSPWVAAYYDPGNMVKFGAPGAEWVRKLGKRLAKLDVKGYSNKKGWVDIGDGDVDWADMLVALGEIGFNEGWATAEVRGGDRKWLADVSQRMDRVLGESKGSKS